MPTKPNRPCCYPGCPALTTERFCPKHKRADDRRRGTAAERGYGSKWARYRKRFLQANPLCDICLEQGTVKAANVVDHIRPHKGDQFLFWATSNHQPLCKACHDRKTATQDGGFGRSLDPSRIPARGRAGQKSET